jgi:hypothetical protein
VIERVKVAVLIGAVGSLIPAAVVVARWSSAPDLWLAADVAAIAAHPRVSDPAILDSFAGLIAGSAPFRRSRRPSEAPYDPVVPETTGTQMDSSAPRPLVVLAGVALGDRPVAVLEGVPGTEGPRVVAEGDTAGGLRVRRVRATGVLVTGYDTSWTLLIKEPWR